MSTIVTAISPVLDAFTRVPFIAGALTKGTLLVLIAVGLTRLLGRSPAAARHLVWSLSVVGLLLLPATALIPWRIELTGLATVRDAFEPTPVRTPAASEPRLEAVREEPASRGIASPAPSAIVDAAGVTETSTRLGLDPAPVVSSDFRWLRDPAMVLIAVWLVGVLLMFARLVVGVANVRRMVREAEPPVGREWDALVESARRSIGVRSPARLLISPRAAMPFTSGLARPVIVLPMSAEDWTPDRRRSVLAHELAHVRRRDLLTNAVVQLACVVYWFHPLVRLAARRVRIEAERSCDALVVAAGTRASDYAGDLLEIARTMRSSATAAVALAVARRSDFEGRLLAILAPDCGRNLLTAARAALIALSFAAPAVAIAAAVPATRVTPNAGVVTRSEAQAAGESADTGAAQVTLAAPVARVTPPAEQSTASQPAAPAQARGRDTAVPALLSVLNDQSAAVRLAAIEALGQQGDPRAIDALVQTLRNDTDARVREAAAEALGNIDSPRAVPGLIAALTAEKEGDVRAKIASALGEIGDPRAVEPLAGAVRDPEVDVRREVVAALGQLESRSAVPALIPALRDSDIETRKRAAEALGNLESPDAIEALSAATKDADADVRQHAVAALGEIGDKRALAVLTAASKDAEVEVRRESIQAIANLDDLESAPPVLIAALKDEDREVRKAAAEALGSIEDEAAVPALIPLTRDTNTDVKRAAVEALANIGGAQAIEVMAALLKDDDPEIRKLAAQALGKSR